MDQKKLAICIATPVLAIAAVTAIALPNVVAPISPTNADPMERTLVLDCSTNGLFNSRTGQASASTNTASGNAIQFSANYVNPSPAGGTYTGEITGHVAENKYTIHAYYGYYWCYFTHDKAFNDLVSISVIYSAEKSDCESSCYMYTSTSAISSYPASVGLSFSGHSDTVDGKRVATFNYTKTNEQFFAIGYAGQAGKDFDYYIDIESITIRYLC